MPVSVSWLYTLLPSCSKSSAGVFEKVIDHLIVLLILLNLF